MHEVGCGVLWISAQYTVYEKMNISYEYILYLATNIAAEYTVWKCVLLALSTEDEKILQLPYSNCSAAGGIGIPC